MHYCLNKIELKQLLEAQVSCQQLQNEELLSKVENAESWCGEIGIVTYLFLQLVESNKKKGESIDPYLEKFFDIENRMSCHIQEFELDFIEFVLSSIASDDLQLEEEIIEAQNQYRNRFR